MPPSARRPAGSSVLVITVLASVALVAGCGTYTGSGGGWLVGKNGGKATVGFDGRCVHEVAEGSLVYIDRSVSPPVNLVMESADCDGTLTDPVLTGSYRARPRGDGGSVTIVFHDTGDGGPSKGDTISVTITGGAFDGYEHAGVIQGGNVTFVKVAAPPATPGG